ncbi:hypothetical protein V8F20_008323 [Naviculisporaceae sp. PSN 640]
MRHRKLQVGLLFGLAAVINCQAVVDKCPWGELACLDIINSSQCIANVILDGRPPLTKANLAKCVEHEGTASDLPGAEKASDGDFRMDERERRSGY